MIEDILEFENAGFNFDFGVSSDMLRELGLVKQYPLHIDVLNNSTGFALYVQTPNESKYDSVYEFEGESPNLHNDSFYQVAQINGVLPHYTAIPVEDYDEENPPPPEFAPLPDDFYGGGSGWYEYRDIPAGDYHEGNPPPSEPTYVPYDYNSYDLYLRIREVENGEPGEWHILSLNKLVFEKNSDAPLALLTHGIDRFDSVAWLEGLKEDSHYQVQLWFESDGNGRLDSVGRYIRDATVEHLYTDDAGNAHVRVLPGDYYYWQEADLYSGIHNIQTNPQEFNIDIDADGVMDYFIS